MRCILSPKKESFSFVRLCVTLRSDELAFSHIDHIFLLKYTKQVLYKGVTRTKAYLDIDSLPIGAIRTTAK